MNALAAKTLYDTANNPTTLPATNLALATFNAKSFSQIYAAVTTIAGSTVGNQDGTGTGAKFNYPSGLCIDSNGVLYVCDSVNNQIKRITGAVGLNSGTVTTIAGSGTAGTVDGQGTAAQFNAPFGICINSAGVLFIADASNHAIRMISPSGYVTTIAGTKGSSGYNDNTTGTLATFTFPFGICIDSSGNLYVADTGNNRIRKINGVSPYAVTTIAGNGTAGFGNNVNGLLASFYNPYGICIDSAGNLYVGDTNNAAIRKIIGFYPYEVQTLASGTAIGQAYGLCIDNSGVIYYSSYIRYRIIRVSSAGFITIIAGISGTSGSTDGIGTNAIFNYPTGVCVNSSGDLYVGDRSNQRIRKIYGNSPLVTTVAGSGTAGSADGQGVAASFRYPYAVCVYSTGNLYVADTYNHIIRMITPGGLVTTIAGLAGTSGTADGIGTAARFNYPKGICIDPTIGGDLYVADSSNQCIRKISTTSPYNVTTIAGNGTAAFADGIGTAARFSTPQGICLDSTRGGDFLYVADSSNQRIRKISTTSPYNVTTIAGNGTAAFADNTTGTSASFNGPAGICIDSTGNLYVADVNNCRVRRINAVSPNAVTTIAGSVIGTSADGTGTTAGFSFPYGICIDSNGVLYVVDSNNNKIRRIIGTGADAGLVTTIAGSQTISGEFADGQGVAAKFNYPTGLCVDSSNNLYVADTNNNKIRKLIL
jgi:sugar lactone lactonase YvrE